MHADATVLFFLHDTTQQLFLHREPAAEAEFIWLDYTWKMYASIRNSGSNRYFSTPSCG